MAQVLSEHNVIVEWYNFLEDLIFHYYEDHTVILGGPNSVVEIVESQYFKCKFLCGAGGAWVLGMVE